MAIIGPTSNYSLKKLRKLPHVFGKVLELPFRSDADVLIENSPENMLFTEKIDVLGRDYLIYDMSVRTMEINPGVTKIVVRKCDPGWCHVMKIDHFDIGTWRFRLRQSAQPDMASVALVDGQLIVTVPKAHSIGPWPGDSRLVLAQ